MTDALPPPGGPTPPCPPGTLPPPGGPTPPLPPRYRDCLGRRAQLGERQLEHEGAAHQAPAAQQRRRLGRRRAEHTQRRVGEADRLGHRGPRLRDQAADGTDRAAQQLPVARKRRDRPLPEAVAEQVTAAHVARHRHRRHRPRLRVPLGVVDLLEQGEPAQPVGDGVAELGQQRGPALFQAFHVHRLPQGARGVQRRLQDDLGQVEELAQRTRGRQRDPAQVVVQVEVGIDHPPRRRCRYRRDHHLLPHPDDHPAGPVHRLAQPGPVGRAVEDLHVQERGSGGRIRLAAVHQVVQRAQLVGLPDGRWRLVGHNAPR